MAPCHCNALPAASVPRGLCATDVTLSGGYAWRERAGAWLELPVVLCGLTQEMKSLPASTALLLCALQVARAAPATAPYGLETRIASKPYLLMPHTADGKIPALLSQTGAFKDTRNLVPSDGLIPYELALAFWSDGADKLRWISVPKGEKIGFAPTGEWRFPAGTVLVKTFELPVD